MENKKQVGDGKVLDRIRIHDLAVRCIVGIRDWERTTRQGVLINVTLYADLSEACRTDEIIKTIDYKLVKDRIIKAVEDSEFQLVEGLAQEVAGICLSEPRVERVDVTVDKPGALRFARSVAVEITRLQVVE
jgi:FolB domain-containing protein